MVTIHVHAAQACNESVAHDQLLACLHSTEVRETSSLHAHVVAGMRRYLRIEFMEISLLLYSLHVEITEEP